MTWATEAAATSAILYAFFQDVFYLFHVVETFSLNTANGIFPLEIYTENNDIGAPRDTELGGEDEACLPAETRAPRPIEHDTESVPEFHPLDPKSISGTPPKVQETPL